MYARVYAQHHKERQVMPESLQPSAVFNVEQVQGREKCVAIL